MNRQELIDKLNKLCSTQECDECPLWDTGMCSEACFEDMTNDQLMEAHKVLYENWAKLNTEEAEKPVNKPSDKNEDEDKTAKVNTTNGEQVIHPDHYNRSGAMECWDEMELIWGRQELIQWCIMTSYKYRYRAGLKGNSEEDMQKSDNYMRKAKELKDDRK